jgi:hypothetical protein
VSDVITKETATVLPTFKEQRFEDGDRAGQLSHYLVLVEGEQVGKVEKIARANPKKGQSPIYWSCRIKGQRGVSNAATRAAAVMGAIEGAFVAS